MSQGVISIDNFLVYSDRKEVDELGWAKYRARCMRRWGL